MHKNIEGCIFLYFIFFGNFQESLREFEEILKRFRICLEIYSESVYVYRKTYRKNFFQNIINISKQLYTIQYNKLSKFWFTKNRKQMRESVNASKASEKMRSSALN